jgi:hypothetical protein
MHHDLLLCLERSSASIGMPPKVKSPRYGEYLIRERAIVSCTGGTLDPEGMPLRLLSYTCLPPLKAPGAATITGQLCRINIGIRIKRKDSF